MSDTVLEVGQVWQQREGALVVQRRIVGVVSEGSKCYVIYNRRFVGGGWSPLEFRKELPQLVALLSVGGAELVLTGVSE